MDITRCGRWWLVTIPQKERVEMITVDGDHPPDHAIAAIALVDDGSYTLLVVIAAFGEKFFGRLGD